MTPSLRDSRGGDADDDTIDSVSRYCSDEKDKGADLSFP